MMLDFLIPWDGFRKGNAAEFASLMMTAASCGAPHGSAFPT